MSWSGPMKFKKKKKKIPHMRVTQENSDPNHIKKH